MKSEINITIIGPDKKGIVAEVTKYIFTNSCNIEEVSQNVLNKVFFMNVKVSANKNFQKTKFNNGLNKLAEKLGLEAKLYFEKKEKLKNMAILVTKEPHVLEELLKAHKTKKLKINIPIVIGTTNKLKEISKKFGIKFLLVKDNDQTIRERRILKILEKNNVDFIVLARYMKILSPKFVWNYTNRIINIHPSLLPAFPGAMAYVQAFEKGVRVSGATAHFVTVDLDQGPIIVQESFKVNSDDQLEKIKRLGKEAENKALLKAVNLFINNKLESKWGRVIVKIH
tara:strand:+ start:1152 stop:2000 length:849 start_codon:yes stop_codon:yes gene_type:complete